MAARGVLNEHGKPFNPKSVSVIGLLTADISSRVAAASGKGEAKNIGVCLRQPL
jgi:hypothetical protein